MIFQLFVILIKYFKRFSTILQVWNGQSRKKFLSSQFKFALGYVLNDKIQSNHNSSVVGIFWNVIIKCAAINIQNILNKI